MNSKVLLCFFALMLAPLVRAQEIDGSDIAAQLRDREARVNRLSVEDQLKIRAAEQKAAQDPAVKAAMEKRNQAIREYRATVRASMIKADPSLAPLLEKVMIPESNPSP
jgi:outer membrane murein-binding lipoprotein Lpp